MIVATAERRVKRDGQAVTATVKKFATAHDLRGRLAPDGPSGLCPLS